MPLKLNVGLSRKVGEPNFGSRGASVNLELELESGLTEEPGRLHERIRQLFRLARQSVDDELDVPASPPPAGTNGHPAASGERHGHAPERPATASQARAIWAIANRQRIDLQGLLRNRFGVDRPEELSLRDASRLIDELKGPAETAGARR